jgi:ABC-type antimicrobial peptide transport system permease subunit
MQLAAAFAAAALALTCLGVYGVLAYAVAVRRRDIGVRRALGADTRRVVAEVIREGLGLALVGAAGGLVVAALTATFLRGLLYGVEPRDPVSFGAGLALVVAGAALACFVPAWRAASVSPMEALRGE